MSIQTDTPETVELGNVRVNYLESATTVVTDILVPNTSTADIQVQSALQVQTHASAPPNPPAGYANLYPNATGTLVTQTTGGTVTTMLGTTGANVPLNAVVVGQGTAELGSVTAGTANQVLAVSPLTGAPVWADTLPNVTNAPLAYSVYNATALTLTGTNAPIPFDNFEGGAGKSVFMLTSNDTQLYCSVPGQYFIYITTTLQRTAGTNTSTSAQMFLNNVAVDGTYIGTYHTSATQTGSSNAMFAVLTLAQGDLIEIRARVVSGTGTITSFVQGNSLLTLQYSLSQYFFAHSPTAVSQTNTLQTVNFGTVAATTANFTNASGVVTVGAAGIYLIVAKASFTSVNANDIQEEVQILVNNVAQDAGGFCWQGDTGIINSCDMLIVRNLNANDNVRVQTRITSGTSASSTLQDIGCAICIYYMGPTSAITAAGFNSNAATALGTGATTFTLNTTTFDTSGTAFTLAGNQVTFNEAGTYYLFTSISANPTVATAAGSRMWFNITSDTIVMQMEGTQMLGTHTNSTATGRDHLLTFTVWQAKVGQQVSLQGLRTGGATSTLVNGSALYIVRMSATGQTAPSVVYPQLPGSWLSVYRSNWVSTVTTTTVVSKGIFMTEYLPDGIYFITYTFQNTGGTTTNSGRFIIQQDGFSTTLLVNALFPQVTGSTPIWTGTEIVRLDQGSHALHIRYASSAAVATSIFNVCITLRRLG